MPRIEFVILADRADTVGGKLYVQGGGWDRLTVRGPDHAPILSVAVSVLVEPDDVGVEHRVHIVVGARGRPPRAAIEGGFQTQRSPADALATQRVLVSLPALPVSFPESGVYEAVASLNGDPETEMRTPFYVTVTPAVEAPSTEKAARPA